jgi:hypothetical protein
MERLRKNIGHTKINAEIEQKVNTLESVKQILCHLHTQFDYELVARLILLKYLLA